ncbi:major facilitator superfamily domain-containing protein [Microdochium bolleyi]|uniref:Major facilitator superfamily domain-containing protein n=1 Tax=Microdochium bolleyi TaxID=196109 RepID=A0A136ISG1_9PEZI|nr:major facilitator superfamily domain-containing protein [Microdochium bolleyi]
MTRATPVALDHDVENALKSAQYTQGAASPDHMPTEMTSPWITSPENPHNWPTFRKVTIILIVSLSHLATTMSASMMAASLGQIADELSMSPATTLLASSIFVLGLGFGPFIVGPMSELYGRRPVWIACNMWYILWNSLCPAGRSAGMLIASRLLAGFGASCGIGLLAPVSADLYGAADRGKSIAIATFLPYIGPALGPIVGGLASEHVHWSWTFWILSLYNTVATLAGLALFRECYGPLLLRQRHLHASFPPAAGPSATKASPEATCRKIGSNLLRPVRMLLFRPVILFISLNMALDFAVYFLVLSTFATLWIERYGMSQSDSSLHYIAITIGAVAATQVGGRFMDYLWRRKSQASPPPPPAGRGHTTGQDDRSDQDTGLTTHDDKNSNPELRILYLVPSVILTPTGLFWYAWAAERHAHWAVVDAGVAIFTLASFMFSAGFQAYMLDEFAAGGTAASANAAVKLLSYILAFVFPLFAPQLYDTLGYGWGNSLLGFVFLGLSLPSVVVAWVWGKRLRGLGSEKVPS